MVECKFPSWVNKEVLTGFRYFLIKYLYLSEPIQAVSPLLQSPQSGEILKYT